MSSSHSRQRTSASAPALPWILLGLFLTVYLGLGMVWVAATLAAAPGVHVPPPSALPPRLARHGLTGLIGATGNATLFIATLAFLLVLVLAAFGAATIAVMRRRRHHDGRRAMSSPRHVQDLRRTAMTRRARGLRPSLAGQRTLGDRDIGTYLGSVGGTPVWKSHEDVELMVCGPRSNKTSAKVVPEILAAPGTVIVTSNKSDVWILTAELRGRAGPVYLCDPRGLTHQPQTWWTNLLGHVTDVASASRMANYFMREVGGGEETSRADPFFTPAAETALRQLILAAACSTKTFRDVREWVATRSDEPAHHLERGGFASQATSLRATLELPPETKGGIFAGVATALACLDSEEIMQWVSPPSTWDTPPREPEAITELNLWDLLPGPGQPRPTLYLLCRNGESGVRPLITALVGELMEIAVHGAAARGGRLDPPMTWALDEAANIVRLPELPSWMSWAGSLGICLTVILQSRGQARGAWKHEGWDALWSASTIKTVGAGVHDSDWCAELSRLIGDHKVEEISTSYSAGGQSTSRNLRTEPILPAADIAALPRTQALLFSSGRRPALLELHPWYNEPDDPDALLIPELAHQATRHVQDAAISALGPDNPVVRSLLRERGEPTSDE